MHQRRTTSAIALDELKRRDQLESLRPFLISEQCFPSSKDPQTSSITLEELKKLVRIWKLNERRNFWKTHSERDEIVSALIQHAEQVFNFTAKSGTAESDLQNSPRSKPEPTATTSNNVTMNINRPVLPSDPKPSSLNVNLRNYCGLRYFNREVKSSELTISSRFYAFPAGQDRVDNVVDRWRSEDFNMKEDFNNNNASLNGPNGGGNSTRASMTNSNGNAAMNVMNGESSTVAQNNSRTVTGLRNKVKLMKQRNLALHLMNYSAHVDFKKTTFTVKSVQTFINVAESDDTKTVSNCMIALSNISADAMVRSILLEINVMHKITNMLQYLRGRASHWAAGLLFYYFSCDKESEDRVYNASSMLLQANGNAKDPQTRLIALYTLNNLMPCIDRQRVAEFTMRILINHFDPNVIFHDKTLMETYLLVLQNMSWFTNAHTTLIHCSILDLLEKFAIYAAKNKNGDVGLSVAKVLLSFLQLPEQAANLVSFEFLRVLTTLLGCDHEQTLVYALKASAVLSSVSTLRKAIIRNSDLMKTVAEMLVQKSSISNSLAKEAAKFISNMTLAMEEAIKFEKQLAALPPAVAAAMLAASSPMSPGGEHQSSSPHKAQHQSTVIIEKFYDDHVYDGIFAILKSTHAAVPTKSIAIHALQNIVAHTANGVKLVSKCLDPMVKFLQNQADLGAIQVLYNLSCIPQCREELVDNKIHIKALELMMLTREGAMKSAYLQILVQLSSSQVCILELLRMDLVSKLESQLKAHSIKCDVWKDISLMMLAIVAYAGDNLVEANQISIVRTLKLICSPTAMHQAATAYIQAATAATTTTTNGNNNNASNVNNLHNNNNHSNQVAKFDGNEFLTAMTTTHLDEIMENGANILKFISVSFDNFEEMDPVVRTIIAYSSDNEEIVDNISHVLYNMTCSEQNIHLMLKDITYLNVMIRIMRNGKVHIQENIAHAMRTFCSINTCVELLLKHDILSDLIVIALLRSSSEEIKTICSEAFYNMLTHEKTRLHLLQGDLWWAFMRLGRTDSEAVRSICVRALSDLATPFNPTLFLEQQEQLQLSAVDPEEYTELDKYNDTVKREEMKQQKAEMQLKCISALRSHHVLSFMKDLSTASSADMLLQCLQVVHNLLHQFADLPSTAEPLSPVVAAPATSTSSKSKNPALVAMRSALDNAPPAAAGTGAVAAVSAQENDSVYVSHEVIACIRIGADAFHRGTTLKAVRIATILLLKCAQLKVDGMESEFINIDIIEVLKSTRESWAQHPDCRLNISRMLYELSKSKIFTKSVTLADMSPILVSCFEHDISAMEICENIVAILLQFVISENIAPKDLIEMGIWPMIIRASLSGDSAIITKHNNTLLATYGGGGGGKSGNSAKASVAMLPTHLISANTNSRRSTSTHGHGAAAATGTTSNGATPPSSAPGSATGGRTRQSLYLREPGAMTNPIEAQNDGIKGPLPSIFRIQGMGLMLLAHTIDVMLEKKADVITPTLLQGLLKADIMDHVWTKHNLLVILHACSTSPACIGALLQEDTFQLLLRYVSTSIGSNRQEKALEFASTFLRNASFHTMMLSKLISIPNQAINEFVREICEYANPLIAMDLSIFFYHIANHLVNSEQYLHPKFVLEMIQKVSSQPEIAEKEYDVININKYTISMILNKYTFGHGVEPSFIQNMFAYIQSNMASYIPELMNELSFKSIPEFKCNLASDFLNVKECLSMDVLLFQGDDRLYQAILHRDVKTQETILLKFSNAFGVSYDRLEMMENVPITVFGKIIKSFDSVKDNMIGNAGHGHGHAGSAIAEEFEEEEEENDDEDGSISAQSSKHHHNNNMEEMVNEEKMPDDFLGESHASHDASLIKIDESEDKEDTGPVYSDTESERSERSERSRRSETDRTVESNASNNKKLNKQPSMIPEDQGGAMSKNNSNAVIANQSSKGQLVTASSNQSLKNTAAVSKPSNNEAAASPSSSNKSDAAPSQKVAADAAMTISELSATTATVTISKPTAALKPEANDEDDFYADDFSAKSAKSKSSRVSKSSKPMTNNKSGKAGDDEDNYSTYSFEDI